MGLLGDLLAWTAAQATAFVETAGYPGIFLLMTMESMFFPVPSEAVMPPAGVLVAEGRLGLWPVILASTLGSVAGSLLSYWIGLKGGAPLLRRYHRWLLLQEKHLDEAERFFERRGTLAVFVARFLPGVRHVSSIPAGAARMPMTPFLAATVVGATAWNLVLLWAGYALGRRWEEVVPYLDAIGYALIALFAAGLLAWFLLRLRAQKRAA